MLGNRIPMISASVRLPVNILNIFSSVITASIEVKKGKELELHDPHECTIITERARSLSVRLSVTS